MVKVALVNNPKTPMQTAMHFLTLLQASDQKAVAKSKNVPSAVANQAKRLVNVKAGAAPEGIPAAGTERDAQSIGCGTPRTSSGST